MSVLIQLAGAAHKHPTWADFGPVEWVAVVVAGLAGLWTVWRAVMLTLNPGETSPEHIKYSILHDEVLQATTQAFRAPEVTPPPRSAAPDSATPPLPDLPPDERGSDA